MPAINWHLN